MAGEIYIPEINVHPNNYRKHALSNTTENRVDEDGHRLLPAYCDVTGCGNDTLYIFGGSVSFGYRLRDNELYAYHLYRLMEKKVVNLSKICNDITNLYYMVLSEKPANSTVILDTGVHTEFQQYSYYKPSIYNLNFSPDYAQNLAAKIVNYLLDRNNQVLAFSYCRDCLVSQGGYSLYYPEELRINDEQPFDIEHPNAEGSLRLAEDLAISIQKGHCLPRQQDNTDEAEWETAQNVNRKLNYYVLHKSREYNRFIGTLKQLRRDTSVISGIIFLAANPLTKGHEYLIQTALKTVKVVYLYSTKNSNIKIPAKYRHAMLEALAERYGKDRVVVLPTCPLKNSLVTFAPYLQKELFRNREVSFVNEHITTFEMMEALGATHRFFGEEAHDRITRTYMEEFIEMASARNIEVHVIPRLTTEKGDNVISASVCRQMMFNGNNRYVDLLPDFCVPTVREYLNGEEK